MGWINEEFSTIDTPFNLEVILASDAKLYEHWKRRPFYLDINAAGNVFVNYDLPLKEK